VHAPSLPTRPDQAVQRGFALWHEAMRWQRAIDLALRPLGLTHTQYLVLSSIERGAKGMLDGVNQRTIARLAGLDESTVSGVIRVLDRRGFVDRGPSDQDIRSWGVHVGADGERALRRARPLAEAAAAAFFGAPDSGREPTSPPRGTK